MIGIMHMRVLLSKFKSSNNPGELFGAEEDASPTVTVALVLVPVVPLVSMLLPPVVPHALPAPSVSAILPAAWLFGPPNSQSLRAASHLSARVQPRIMLPPSDNAAAGLGAAHAGEWRSQESSPLGSFKVCCGSFC